MTVKGFVMIEVEGRDCKEVAAAVGLLEGVRSADASTGPYDVIAVVEGENLNDIGELVIEKIQPIAGISRTVTCLSIAGD